MTSPLNADDALVPPNLASPPGIWDDPPEPEKPVDLNEPREFDAKAKEPFTGLLHVGSLTDEVVLFGHRFQIATPSNTERIQLGLVLAPWRNTLTEEVAFMQATVAAFLVTVDGQALPQPISNNPKDFALRDRFTWVGDNLRKPVIAALFNEVLKLDEQVDLALEAMGKAARQAG